MAALTDVKISGSVGEKGRNLPEDVLKVQHLLNGKIPIPYAFLKEDGVVSDAMVDVIKEIQRRNLQSSKPDGRVDPGGKTLLYLNGGSVSQPKVSAGTIPQSIIDAAQLSEKNWGIPASISIAQWALESGWGAKMPAGSNNPFGIKAVGKQEGVSASTREVVNGKDITINGKFRKFASINEAFDEHGKLLATHRAYVKARSKLPDADAFADALTGTYATDPNYGTILKKIMKSKNLYQYDASAKNPASAP